jgi:hypothetical protein
MTIYDQLFLAGSVKAKPAPLRERDDVGVCRPTLSSLVPVSQSAGRCRTWAMSSRIHWPRRHLETPAIPSIGRSVWGSSCGCHTVPSMHRDRGVPESKPPFSDRITVLGRGAHTATVRSGVSVTCVRTSRPRRKCISTRQERRPRMPPRPKSRYQRRRR